MCHCLCCPRRKPAWRLAEPEGGTRRHPGRNFDQPCLQLSHTLALPCQHSNFPFSLHSALLGFRSLTTEGSVTTELSHSLEELPLLLTQCRALRPGSHRRGRGRQEQTHLVDLSAPTAHTCCGADPGLPPKDYAGVALIGASPGTPTPCPTVGRRGEGACMGKKEGVGRIHHPPPLPENASVQGPWVLQVKGESRGAGRADIIQVK